jgi:hypothetical protein
VPAVVQVVPIVLVIDVHVVALVPVIPPVPRPLVGERDPVAVILEAGVPAYEDHREAVHAEVVVASPVAPEAVVGDAVAVIAAPLTPRAVVVAPVRGTILGAGLVEAAVHLLLVLRDAALVVSSLWVHLIGLDTAVVCAAVGLLVALLLLTLLLLGLLVLLCGLLMLLLCLLVLLLLMLLPLLLMLLPLLPLLFMLLCVGRSNGAEEHTQGSCADS